MSVNLHRMGNRHQWFPTTDVEAGKIYQDGNLAVIPITDWALGSPNPVAGYTSAVHRFYQPDPGLVVGDVVGYDSATNTLVAGGTGDFDCGTYRGYQMHNDLVATHATVLLNNNTGTNQQP